VTLKTLHWWVRRIWITGGVVFLSALGWNIQAHGVPPEMYASDARVRVEVTEYGRAFRPIAQSAKPPFVFIPGGLIDPNAYVPLVRAVADAGVPAAIVNVPWRAAPTEAMRNTLWSRIELATSDIGNGRPAVLGGHSRGGMLASEFSALHPDAVAGLVLIGTTHPRDRDLSSATFPVLKVLGTADCVASVADARANQSRLPVQTQWREIEGANHRQFGYYGWQLGDCGASISREEQHRRVVEAVTGFVRAVE
jgi:pimeloyl-ACP methyl ester carboxylesterase